MARGRRRRGPERRGGPAPSPPRSAKQLVDCRQKQRFASEREADDAAYRKRMEGIRVSVYECPWCGGWHLTSRGTA